MNTEQVINIIPKDFKSTLPPRKRAKTVEEKEQRRIERILRNRKAAHKSRERKRVQLKYLNLKCSKMMELLSKIENLNIPTLSENSDVLRLQSELNNIVDQNIDIDDELFTITSSSASSSSSDNKKIKKEDDDENDDEDENSSNSSVCDVLTPNSLNSNSVFNSPVLDTASFNHIITTTSNNNNLNNTNNTIDLDIIDYLQDLDTTTTTTTTTTIKQENEEEFDIERYPAVITKLY